MTSTIHRWLMFLAFCFNGLGGLMAIPDFEPLGIPSQAGLVMVFVASLLGILATGIRANFGTDATVTETTITTSETEGE